MINFIDVPDDIFERNPATLPRRIRYLYEAAKRYKWGPFAKPPTVEKIKSAVRSILERKNIACSEGRLSS